MSMICSVQETVSLERSFVVDGDSGMEPTNEFGTSSTQRMPSSDSGSGFANGHPLHSTLTMRLPGPGLSTVESWSRPAMFASMEGGTKNAEASDDVAVRTASEENNIFAAGDTVGASDIPDDGEVMMTRTTIALLQRAICRISLSEWRVRANELGRNGWTSEY